MIDFAAPPYVIEPAGRSCAVGVLLVHGFTASPTEMRPLAEYLHAREPGWAIRCVRLAGHGGTLDELKRTDERDWTASVLAGYAALRRVADGIVAIGLSMGAAMAASLAVEDAGDAITGVALLAPVFGVPGRWGWLLPLYGLVRPEIRKPHDRVPYYERHGLISHAAYPVCGLMSLHRLGRAAWSTVPRQRVPCLIVAGGRDRHTGADLINRIERLWGCRREPRPAVRICRAERSGHVLTVEPDARQVFEACWRFARHALAMRGQTDDTLLR